MDDERNTPVGDQSQQPAFIMVPGGKRPIKNLAGMIKGHLVVKGFSHFHTSPDGKRRPLWKVSCSCGVEKAMMAVTLRNPKVVSCGHVRTEMAGWVNSLPVGEAACNLRFHHYRKAAKRFGRPFDLSRDEFVALLLGDCHYCGCPPSGRVRARGKYQTDFYYNGVDRVVNDLGYVAGNVVSCCGVCNMMKRALSVDEFLEHVARIHRFQLSSCRTIGVT